MTVEQAADETADETVETPEEEPTPDPNDDGQEPDEAAPNKEAAKYRRRLRDAETERDALAEQLTNMRRADAERLASQHLAKPAGLWAAGVEIADLLDDTGTIDPAKVTEAAKQAADALGLALPPPGNYAAREGNNPAAAAGGRTSSWDDAFAPRTH